MRQTSKKSICGIFDHNLQTENIKISGLRCELFRLEWFTHINHFEKSILQCFRLFDVLLELEMEVQKKPKIMKRMSVFLKFAAW